MITLSMSVPDGATIAGMRIFDAGGEPIADFDFTEATMNAQDLIHAMQIARGKLASGYAGMSEALKMRQMLEARQILDIALDRWKVEGPQS